MKKTKNKKPNLHSKIGKYYLATQTGVTKQEAQRIAGYSSDTNSTSIEKSKTFQAIQTYFKDEFLQQSSLQELATELLKNIRQDTEKSAKNKAIEIALNRLEPTGVTNIDIEAEKCLVVLKQ